MTRSIAITMDSEETMQEERSHTMRGDYILEEIDKTR